MDGNTSVYCPICFSMPGDPCVSMYLVHGEGNLIPVVAPTHGARIADSDRAQFFLSQKAPR